jgi:hypothetical protein
VASLLPLVAVSSQHPFDTYTHSLTIIQSPASQVASPLPLAAVRCYHLSVISSSALIQSSPWLPQRTPASHWSLYVTNDELMLSVFLADLISPWCPHRHPAPDWSPWSSQWCASCASGTGTDSFGINGVLWDGVLVLVGKEERI